LSPLHIGCDEDYEPTGFVLDEQAKPMISFEPSSFLSLLEGEELGRFSELCRKGTVASLLEIYRFMRQHRDLVITGNLAGGNTITVSPEFLAHYRTTLGLNQDRIKKQFNKFIVARTAYDQLTNTPYLPGTALKGALRTAVLNHRNNKRSRPRYGDSRNMSKKLLGGDFASDPFRLIKVSDFHSLDSVQRRIVYAVNKKKKPSEREASGPYQILEVIDAGAEFYGTITIQEPPGRDVITAPINLQELVDSFSFYQEEMERERHILKKIGGQPVPRPDQAAPIRIGRHSGAECVTVAGQRQIQVRVGRRQTKTLSGATTLWLASESQRPNNNSKLQPFGWAAFTLLTDKESEEIRKKKKSLLNQWEQTGRQALQIHRQHQEKIMQKREQQRLAQERAAEAERKQKEEDEKYPWRKVLREAGRVDNWGDLRTRMLENEALQEFQAESEVGRAVQEAAQKIKKHLSRKQKKKWQQEQRDQVLAEWLEPSGITWEVHAEKQASQAAAKTASSDQEILQQIRELDEFSKWQQLKTPIKKLDLASAEALMEKFQKWKLGKSKKKPEKKAFKDLKQRIANLEKAS